MEYVSRHVDVCSSSVQLYRRVFNRHWEGATPAPSMEALQQAVPHEGPPAETRAETPAEPPPVDIASLDEEPRCLLGEVRPAAYLSWNHPFRSSWIVPQKVLKSQSAYRDAVFSRRCPVSNSQFPLSLRPQRDCHTSHLRVRHMHGKVGGEGKKAAWRVSSQQHNDSLVPEQSLGRGRADSPHIDPEECLWGASGLPKVGRF